MGYKLVRTSELDRIKKENEIYKEKFVKASDFVTLISQGTLDVDYKINEDDEKANTLEKSLLALCEQLKKIDAEEKQRTWAAEGLAKFIEILRDNSQNNNQEFYDKVISSLVKYLDVNQGGLFIVNKTDEKNPVLELKSCYAYSRHKFSEKVIGSGEGMIGQSYLEQKSIYLTEIPEEYFAITSGLGQANPSSLFIVPLKTNDEVVGVIELASFTTFKEYQREFIEKLSENIAVNIRNLAIQERTNELLTISQESTEELRAQEEELRQNMEEVQAIQEDLERNIAEMKAMKEDMEIREKVFGFTTIMSEADLFGNIIYANDKLCTVSKYTREELIGQPHSVFRHPDMPKELFKTLWDTLKKGDIFKGIIKNKAKDGSIYWVDATIVPIKDKKGEVFKYVGARYLIEDENLAQSLFNNQKMIKDLENKKGKKGQN